MTGSIRLGRLLPLNLLLIVEPSILLHHHFHQLHIFSTAYPHVAILGPHFEPPVRQGGEVRTAHQSSAEKQGSFC